MSQCVVPTVTCTTNKCIIVIPWTVKAVTVGKAPPFPYSPLHRSGLDVYNALHCTALHCTALHCTALHCTALQCFTVLGIKLHCTVLRLIALHCTELLCPALQSIAEHRITLHCNAEYYTAPPCTALYWTISPYTTECTPKCNIVLSGINSAF